jgi:hypothetical protein
MGKNKKSLSHREHTDHREELLCHVRGQVDELRRAKKGFLQGLRGLCGSSFGRLKRS